MWTPQFDTLKVQDIFSFMDIALAITLECEGSMPPSGLHW